MGRDGSATREKILETTQRLFLARGFSGTSIDHVIEEAGVTKGAFFYHFENKDELARVVIERFAKWDRDELDKTMQRAEMLSRDPLQQYLIFIGLFIEHFQGLSHPYPGCLYASYCYQIGVLQENSLKVVADSIRYWRQRICEKLGQIMEQHSPRLPVNLEALADMALAVFEGACIVSKTLKEPKITADQLIQYRNYIELLFPANPASQLSKSN